MIDIYPNWLTKEIDQYKFPKEMIFDFYPDFDKVFADDTLKGLFYPLCTVSSIPSYPNTKLHFVSSNGVWLDEQYNNIENNNGYVRFKLIDNLYVFQGDFRLYRGHDIAKDLYKQLEAYFTQNIDVIMQTNLKVADYIELMKQEVLDINFPEKFDLNYYIETFYEFTINREIFKITGKFNQYENFINSKNFTRDSKILNNEKVNPIKSKLYNDWIYSQYANIFDGCMPIGRADALTFFSDGNDSELFFNQDQEYALSVNFYS